MLGLEVKTQMRPNKTKMMSFKNRLFFVLLSVVGLHLFIIGFAMHSRISSMLNHEFSTRALILAEQLSVTPSIIHAMQFQTYETIRPIIEKTGFPSSDANFIVIGNRQGIQMMDSGVKQANLRLIKHDIDTVMQQQQPITSLQTMKSSCLYTRASVPVFSANHQIIGVVTVGYSMTAIHSWRDFYLEPLLLILIIILFSSIIAAHLFAKHIKSKMLNMEPDELLFTLQCKSAMLQSLDEGVVALDDRGHIRSINQFALQFLGLKKAEHQLLGTHVAEVISPATFFFPKSVESVKNQIIHCNGNSVIANRIPCRFNRKNLGFVISFRPKNDINTLVQQLSQMKSDTEQLRIMKHEYANKLSTIGGLIQIGAYEEALETVQQRSQQTQQMVDFFTKTFNNAKVAGLLLTKYVRAQEIGLHLEFDPACQLNKALPVSMNADALVTILGNLIDNAYEATLKNPASNKQIYLFLTDQGDELVIELTDNGLGISPSVASTLFERGVTTKAESGHGYGMYLIHQYVSQAGGQIILDNIYPSGTVISLFIPLEGQAHE